MNEADYTFYFQTFVSSHVLMCGGAVDEFAECCPIQ